MNSDYQQRTDVKCSESSKPCYPLEWMKTPLTGDIPVPITEETFVITACHNKVYTKYVQKMNYQSFLNKWNALYMNGSFRHSTEYGTTVAWDLLTKIPLNGTVFLGTIPAPPHPDVLKDVIGKDGKNVKEVTTDTKVDFIWYDCNTHTLTVWGQSEPNVFNAMNMLRLTIYNLYSSRGLSSHITDVSFQE